MKVLVDTSVWADFFSGYPSAQAKSLSRLEVHAPVPLFHVETDVANYDVSPDGSRFLVSTRLERFPESPLRVILNWDALLPRER